MPNTLAILAPGLLGASVARAARARGAAQRIVVWARRPEVRVAIESQPWCDATAASPADAVREADFVVLAPPVERIISLAKEISPHLRAGAIVTDVGSVKGDICRQCSALLREPARFVGSHPMAGGEKTGWEHASPGLFENRTIFVTPLPETDAAAAESVTRFWSDLGGQVTTLHPDQHDEIVAHISHLPQALATTLAGFLATRHASWRNFAGGGLRDTTRIAASDPTMWVEIFQQNRDEVLRALRACQDELQAFQAALANRDWIEIRARLERGKAWRDGFRP